MANARVQNQSGSEGHAFFMLGFEGDWPPSTRSMMVDTTRGSESIKIFVDPDGSLEFIVANARSVYIRQRTKPVQFRGSGMFLLDAGWKDGHTNIRINGHLVPTLIEPIRPFVIDLNQSEFPKGRSIDDPRAELVSEKWIRWRLERFGKAKLVNSDHVRNKSFGEQVEELRNAILGLRHHIDQFEEGKKFLIVDIAASLRALVYWEDGNSSKYNPLLLRIAARINPPVPLPIYSFRKSESFEPEVVRQADLRTKNSWVSIFQEFPMQTLMDLQEALNSSIQIERFRPSLSAKQGKEYRLRGRDLIREFASTAATGHYHEHVKRDFDRMHATKVFDMPLSYQFILRIGSVVTELGEFVIGLARKE